MPRDVDTSKRIAVFIAAFFIFSFMLFSVDNEPVTGNLVGHIYGQDGSTPLEGASLALRNVSTGKVYMSPKSGLDGTVLLEEVEKGFYKIGIITDDGGFYTKDLIGLNIKGESTETISVSISPYSQQEGSAVRDIYEDLYGADEALIGHVLKYFPETGMAQVELIKGMIKKDAVVYFRGLTYNFRQEVKTIILDGKEVDEAYKGDIILVNVKMPTEIGDLVFICDKKILPFIIWGKPLGLLILGAATTSVTYGIYNAIQEEPETSPFRPNK
jgi:hypothetical protein